MSPALMAVLPKLHLNRKARYILYDPELYVALIFPLPTTYKAVDKYNSSLAIYKPKIKQVS
jgi:hypothetical protein